MAKGGIATLRFDKPGVAGNFPHRPQELAAFSRWENFVDDVVSAFYFLESQAEVDSKRIAMVGHSEGGMLALEATSRLRRDHREPAALVLAATPGRKCMWSCEPNWRVLESARVPGVLR